MSKWLLCVLMALTFTAGSALAKDDAKPRKKKPARAKKARTPKAKSVIRGEYAIMVSELKFTDAQKTKLIELIKAQNEARKATAEASKPLRAEQAEAKKAGNKEKLKEIAGKLKALRGDPKADRAKIAAIMTPEQKASWAKFGLYRNACRKFARAKLTDDQKKAIRDMCAKSDVKVTGDKKADNAALKALTDKIAADVLTDEQREAIKPKPRVKKEKPAGGKKPREKRGKKKPTDQ
ncbi:MAG: Spy/CpxP family protein refolding chaperone [Phycisphaerae bacterium]|nr:Spy/CpxP family protein refolding chaperone [Phycisphaerae bacterium]